MLYRQDFACGQQNGGICFVFGKSVRVDALLCLQLGFAFTVNRIRLVSSLDTMTDLRYFSREFNSEFIEL